jgi:predicted RNA-binding protein with PUA-like domain
VPKPKPIPFVSTGYWLLKSEPESYSIDLFAKEKKTLWTGVRNYQARNFMVDSMKPGDKFIFYHSNAEPSAAVGVGAVVRPNQADPSAVDKKSEYYDPKASSDHPIWFCAEVSYEGHLKKPVTLQDLRDKKELEKMALLQRGQRLSVLPMTKSEFETVVKMGGGLK